MEDRERRGEEGSMLVGLVVAIFLILLALSVAAPTVARELQREREEETVHRAEQYVRAIQLYYKKVGGQYPATLEQLEKTNNVRFLRRRYVDPMTGKVDWRLIKVGEAKTTVKGFFGKPLTGLAPGLGSAAGMASSGGIGAGAAGSSGATSSGSAFGGASTGGSAFGASSGGGSAFGGSSGGSAFGGSSDGSSAFGSSPTSGAGGIGSSSGGAGLGSSGLGSTGSTGSSGSSGSSGGIASQSATSFTGGGAPFVGVGVPKDGSSLIVVNEQTTYKTWEFLYDPRVEQMKAQSSLFGGGVASGSGTGLGSASGMSSGVGGSSGSGSAFGSGSSSSFGSGSGSGSGFGSGTGSGFGSTPSSGTGTSGTGTPAPTTQPQ